MERKQQEARLRILAAARALFAHGSGYEQATVREIATRADVSVGAVYLHFASKPDILAHLVKETIQSVIDDLSEALSRDMSGVDQFRTFIFGFWQFTANRRSRLFTQLLIRLGPEGYKEVIETILPPVNRLIAVLTGIIERGITDGSIPIRRWKPGLVALVLFQCLQGLAIFDFGNQQFRSRVSAGFTVKEVLSCFEGLASSALSGGWGPKKSFSRSPGR
jgi:AcrR family transcriptional regulator